MHNTLLLFPHKLCSEKEEALGSRPGDFIATSADRFYLKSATPLSDFVMTMILTSFGFQ
jgi:hypothetical protein